MTRDEGVDPILQPWMARNAPAAPDDLLPRVMREVDTMSQRTTTWPRFLTATHTTTWVAVTAVVAILAVSIGAYLISNRAAPVGTTQTPSPTPATGATAPTTVAQLVDANIAATNAYDANAVDNLYLADATLRIASGWPSWTEKYDGLDQIKATVADDASIDFTLTRTGSVLENGPYAAHAFTYAGTAGDGYGFAVYLISDLKIRHQWNILLAGAPPAPPTEWEGTGWATNVIDDAFTAWSAGGDGAAGAALYAVNGDLRYNGDARFAISSSDFNEVYLGRDAISQTIRERGTVNFKITRTGAVIRYGDLYICAGTYRSDTGSGKMFAVFELTDNDTVIMHQWGFGG